MGRLFRRIIVTLCCTILLAAIAQAKTPKEVYLKDGGVIVCQKVWQTNDKVMVLVNRDILVDLSKDEVDLKKTFGKKPVKAVKKKGNKKVVVKHGAVMPQAALQPPAIPPAALATAHKTGGAPAVKPPPSVIKPAPQQHAASTAIPAPSAAQPPTTKHLVQGAATSVVKPAPAAVASPPRISLPLAKPVSPPPPKPSVFTANGVNIGLVALLVLLVAGYVVYKKQHKS
jgi:hypothetical protein